jgi:3-phytase
MLPTKKTIARDLGVAALALVTSIHAANAGNLEAPSSPAGTPAPAAVVEVSAHIETAPVPNAGDAADDPAIWVHPSEPSKSLIIGSDKLGGIGVYDMSGRQLQYVPAGKINNVDLRKGFKLGGREVAIVAGSNRTDDTIALYAVDGAAGTLENVAARAIPTVAGTYGACLYRSPVTGKFYYFTTSKKGAVEQYELFETAGAKIDAKKVRAFDLGSVVEGCVADDELGQLYVAQEDVGIWKFGAEPEAGDKRTQVDKAGPGGQLMADVEGLTIAYGADGKGFLMVSSQGNHSYVVYRREGENAYVKSFRIVDGGGLDGAQETDGIDVTTASLGEGFPHGAFVAQDGFNDSGNQNFKIVPLERIIPGGVK